MGTYATLRAAAKESHEKRQRHHPAARRDGGAVESDARQDRKAVAEGVHKHEAHLHRGEPKTKLRDGGKVEGRARGGRSDRPKHGAGKTTVNIVMPQGGGAPHPVPVPVPARPPLAAGAPPGAGMPPGAPMPPRPPLVPPQGGMGPVPAGMPPRARGGRMTAGAGGGEGRIEKAEGKRGWVE